MESRETFLSLYDYLGKAAGSALGRKVASAAYKSKIQPKQRPISNPTFAGMVFLYPKDFLDGFFAEPDPMDDATLGDLQDYYSLNK
jgi:hypothetical protein